MNDIEIIGDRFYRVKENRLHTLKLEAKRKKEQLINVPLACSEVLGDQTFPEISMDEDSMIEAISNTHEFDNRIVVKDDVQNTEKKRLIKSKSGKLKNI